VHGVPCVGGRRAVWFRLIHEAPREPGASGPAGKALGAAARQAVGGSDGRAGETRRGACARRAGLQKEWVLWSISEWKNQKRG
jgi:hypothetical protein